MKREIEGKVLRLGFGTNEYIEAVFGYKKKEMLKNSSISSVKGDSMKTLYADILWFFYDISEIVYKDQLEDASKVIIWEMQNCEDIYSGCLIVPKLDNSVIENINKMYAISNDMLQDDIENLSDEEFVDTYRCKKQELSDGVGVLLLIGNEDYCIMSGENYEMFDKILNEFTYKVEVY